IEADDEGDVFFESEEYPAEELEQLLKKAEDYKLCGNQHFGQAEYAKAIEAYENALMTCPLSLQTTRANDSKAARESCTKALTSDPNYTKARLRRAQASEKIGTYTSLSEALKDYQALKTSNDTHLQSQAQRAERELPPRIQQQMEKEKDEMLGKLKEVGNTLLGKFGLSTDNFQFTQDPSGQGGYSVNFVNK
ncbi:hypothetical protein BY458DRAFT_445615, partial [Sporodiniella umbellata]